MSRKTPRSTEKPHRPDQSPADGAGRGDRSPGGGVAAALRHDAQPVDASGAIGRFRARAEREGLVEIAYSTVPSPHGDLLIAATDQGLIRIALPIAGIPADGVLEQLARSVSPRMLESAGRLDQARRELDGYFEGRVREFTIALDRRLISGFQTRVLAVTQSIPYGITRSYGEVATDAGNARAQRAAGTALARNPLPLVIPCHRVLRAGGAVGSYGGGSEMKRALLALEGALEAA